MTRAALNQLVYSFNARRRAAGRCPYCATGRLEWNEDTGRRYSRCANCNDKQARGHERRRAARKGVTAWAS